MTEEDGFFAQVAVTNRCNLSCLHCYRDLRKPFANELSTGELTDLLQQIQAHAARLGRSPHVVFSGGEPLTRPDIGLLVQVAESMGISANLNTNATLIDPHMAKALFDWGIRVVQVSLDGPTPESHDHVRGRGNFERAVAGISHLRNQGIEVMVKVTLMPGTNTHLLAEFYALAQRLGVQVLSFARLIPIGPGAKLQRWTPQSYRSTLETLSREASASQGVRTEIRDAGFDRAFALRYPHVFHSEEGISFMAFDADGTAYAGRRTPIALGNIRDTDLVTLWEHPVLMALRAREINGKCSHCELYEACGGGSRAAAYGATGDYLAPDPHCWYEPGLGDRLKAAS